MEGLPRRAGHLLPERADPEVGHDAAVVDDPRAIPDPRAQDLGRRGDTLVDVVDGLLREATLIVLVRLEREAAEETT